MSFETLLGPIVMSESVFEMTTRSNYPLRNSWDLRLTAGRRRPVGDLSPGRCSAVDRLDCSDDERTFQPIGCRRRGSLNRVVRRCSGPVAMPTTGSGSGSSPEKNASESTPESDESPAARSFSSSSGCGCGPVYVNDFKTDDVVLAEVALEKASSLDGLVNPAGSVPWLTVTPSNSETDSSVESRSQSISSQDSTTDDQIKDDSGIDSGGFVSVTVSGCGVSAGVLTRNDSAPFLNGLDVVVCRPSNSPLDFRSEPTASSLLKSQQITSTHDGHTSTFNFNFNPNSTFNSEHPTTTNIHCDTASTTAANARPSDFSNCTPGEEAYMRVVRFLPSWDLERLSTVFRRLDDCHFYVGRRSFDDAKLLLASHPVGTFLLRDSSNSNYLFSLSIQTMRGTTSIRIVYEAGLFRLDSQPEQDHLMPTFDCVVRLVHHYIRLDRAREGEGQGQGQSKSHGQGGRNNFVFLEHSGRKDTPVLLRRAYARSPPALKHLCRLRINRLMRGRDVHRLHLIHSLKTFLVDYPYDI